MNTRFCYMYRDADNYKQHGEVVFAGDATDADIALIASKLHDGECFLPADVGLSPLQGRYHTGIDLSVDHVWHEVVPADDVVATNEEPTVERTWDDFVTRWRELDGWDEHPANEQLHERSNP